MVTLPFPYPNPPFMPSLVLSSETEQEEQAKEDHSPHRSTDDSSYRYLTFLIIVIVPTAVVIVTVAISAVIGSIVWIVTCAVVRIVGS
jgi:hypothetical protein